MKKLIYIAIITIIVWSCGGGGDDPKPAPTPTPTPVENKAPSTPSQVYPTNNLLCIDNAINFQWNAAVDPDGDAISYLLEVAVNNQFSPVEHSLTVTGTSKDLSLEKGIGYYWRVKAKDSKNLEGSYSSVYSFYTEGNPETNHLPFSPELVQPDLNSVVQNSTVTLKWTASDVDTSDTLTFDIFFGTENPPTTKKGDNQTTNSLDFTVVASTNYYWKVVVKDDKGGEAIGQIWNFKTD